MGIFIIILLLLLLLIMVIIIVILIVVDPIRYSIGNIIVYSSLQACSGILASTLSKVISSNISKGTYNASFLTTIFGDIGKTFGNLFIILAGYINLRNLLNLLFIPCFFLILINIFICIYVKFHKVGNNNNNNNNNSSNKIKNYT